MKHRKGWREVEEGNKEHRGEGRAERGWRMDGERVKGKFSS